jgi:hypothetical protein
MPQRQHCPPAKHHGYRNPEYHEEQQKDVESTLVAHPPKTPKRNTSSSTNEMLHTDIIMTAQRTRVNSTHGPDFTQGCVWYAVSLIYIASCLYLLSECLYMTKKS